MLEGSDDTGGRSTKQVAEWSVRRHFPKWGPKASTFSDSPMEFWPARMPKALALVEPKHRLQDYRRLGFVFH